VRERGGEREAEKLYDNSDTRNVVNEERQGRREREGGDGGGREEVDGDKAEENLRGLTVNRRVLTLLLLDADERATISEGEGAGSGRRTLASRTSLATVAHSARMKGLSSISASEEDDANESEAEREEVAFWSASWSETEETALLEEAASLSRGARRSASALARASKTQKNSTCVSSFC